MDKDERNAEIRRVIKEVAWDCALHYKRNVLPTDEENSRVCDYQDCNYRCDGFPSNSIDRSGKVWQYNVEPNDILYETYDLLFSQDIVEKYKEQIFLLFQKHFALSYDVIKKTLNVPKGRDMILLHALDYIVESKTYIQNRYGFPSFLHEAGDIYYLAEDMIPRAKRSFALDALSGTYAKYPILVDEEDVMEKVQKYELRHDAKKVALYQETGKTKHLNEIFRIRDLYEKFFDDPNAKTMLDRVIPAQHIRRTIGGIPFHQIPENRYITQKIPVRIYDKEEGKWRDATLKEISSFNRKSTTVNVADRFKGRDFYAVRNTAKGGINITFPEGGKHRKGTKCSSYSKKALVDIGEKLGIQLDESMTKDTLCRQLEDEFVRQDLVWE